MPALDNIRHERFCRGLILGKTADQAYQDAGFRPHRGNASRLSADERIQARVAELKREAAEAATIDRAWVLQKMQNLYGLTSTPKKDEPTWSPATAKGLLELFGRETGMFIERKIIGIKRLEDMADDELRQIAGEVIEELDAQVTVDGDVQQVTAELLPPVEDTQDGDNATPVATQGDGEGIDANAINKLGGPGN